MMGAADMGAIRLRLRMYRLRMRLAGWLRARTAKNRRQRRIGLTAFCFHDVTDRPSDFARDFHLAVSPQRFLELVTWISSRFNPVSPDALLPGAGPLPDNAALITFDDGWRGTFDHGLPILERLRLPAIVFLNMEPVIHGEPLISAVGCYLERRAPHILDKAGIERPAHLHLTPEHKEAAITAAGADLRERVLAYQGALATEEILKHWDGSNLVRFGNHLFNHWNPVALKAEEMSRQLARNAECLQAYGSAIAMLAFPNGHYGTCFDDRHIDLARELKIAKVFSAMPIVNETPSNFMLHRLSMTSAHDSPASIWATLYS